MSFSGAGNIISIFRNSANSTVGIALNNRSFPFLDGGGGATSAEHSRSGAKALILLSHLLATPLDDSNLVHLLRANVFNARWQLICVDVDDAVN